MAGAIREMGYRIVPQVGCSGFRVDLGVIEPANPGRFVLGVECDGATYHSGYVARDKDRLRQEVLERLGWQIHRVWSPDWTNRRASEVERLRSALEAAETSSAKAAPTADNPGDDHTVAPAPAVNVRDLDDADQSLRDASWTMPYTRWHVRRRTAVQSEFHSPANRAMQARLIGEIVDVEGPVHVELVARRLAESWGLERVGNRMRAAVKEAMAVAKRRGAAHLRGDFLWPSKLKSGLEVRVPVPGDPDTLRQIEHIPLDEIRLAMRHIVAAGVGVSKKALLVEVARVFGFDRTGSRIRRRLLRALADALGKGDLVEQDDIICVNSEAH